MQFHYSASDQKGKVSEGDYDAPTVAEVLSYLSGQGLIPLSVKPVRTIFKFGMLQFGQFEKMTLEDKLFLMKYLSLMMKVGTDLFKAIEILIEDAEKPIVRRFLVEIKTNLEKGNPFYIAFQSHPEYFSPVVVSLLRAGETSGNLEKTFNDISTSFAKEADLTARIRGALMYPVVLLIAASGIVTLIVTFLIPRIATIFLQTGAKIPLYSRIVLTVGLFLGNNFWFIIPPILVAISAAIYFSTKTAKGRKIALDAFEKIPVIKNLLSRMALERFATTFSDLLKAGIPMTEALEITADAVGREDYREALLRISREGISRGISIGDSFRRENLFPKIITNLMAIGEKAGHLDEILTTLATFFEHEIDNALKAMVTFLEPALLMVIGIIVAVLALSVIVPIYQLVTQF